MYKLVETGGMVVLSVTYHSYLKNLALAMTGHLDQHLNALWDAGPLKFFSIPTLRELLTEVGFSDVEFYRAGRIPILAKSVIAVGRSPR
jgi:hypothetical protein